jgi:hypothetical protein
MTKAGRKSTPKNRQPPVIIGTLNVTEESDKVSIQARVDDLPEFISIAHEAIRHFRVSANSYPKKEGLVEYFQRCRLSNGTFISRHQADSLATFCRPVQAMKGGNKKRVKPFNP